MYLTYGDEVNLTSTYVTTTPLGDIKTVEAAWSCTGFSFDKTSAKVGVEKQTQTAPTGTTTDYYVYTASITAKATAAGSTTLWSQIGGNPAKVNGIDGVAVKVAKKRIDVPVADKTVFVYQKDLKQYPQFAENDAYTVTIPDASTEIGNYKVTLALANPANTEWNSVDKDGKPVYDDAANKSITYSIVKRDFESELAELQKKYDELFAEKEKLAKDSATEIASLNEKVGSQAAKLAKKTTSKVKKIKVNGKTVKVKATATAKNGKVTVTSIKVVK